MEINGETRPECVILHNNILVNGALKPIKLERHVKTIHPNYGKRSRQFFEHKLTHHKEIKPSVTSYVTSEETLY